MIYLALICGLQMVLLIAVLLADRRSERQEVRAERADLLQRIQAPQYATVQHYNDHQEIVAPPAVNPDLDDDYWLSKDDLAERAARDEVTSGN